MTAVHPTATFPLIRPLMEARGYEPGMPPGRVPEGPVGRAPAARELAALREAVPDFRSAVTASGTVDAVATADLVTLPYPTRFGLWRAAATPAPFLWLTNRMLVVQWTDDDGTPRTMLWEPTDHERGRETPYYQRLRARSVVPEHWLTTSHGTVLSQLYRMGIDRADVDYVAFDHLHTQDVRRLLGTTRPAPDLGSGEEPVVPWLPNARLIVQTREWDTARNPHPLQAPWYQPDTYEDVRSDALAFIDGDVQLGPGVALAYTPGHTLGNMTLVLHTDTGLWTSSENGIAAECYTPEASRIPGVRRWAATWGQEVILNANVLEFTAWQYNSMVVEKEIADMAGSGPFRQNFPSSELVGTRLSPGTAPTFSHRAIRHGRVRAARA